MNNRLFASELNQRIQYLSKHLLYNMTKEQYDDMFKTTIGKITNAFELAETLRNIAVEVLSELKEVILFGRLSKNITKKKLKTTIDVLQKIKESENANEQEHEMLKYIVETAKYLIDTDPRIPNR